MIATANALPTRATDADRAVWLLDAAAWLRVLDPVALAGRRVAILEAAGTRPTDTAFTSPAGIFDLVRDQLPASGMLPGPVVFIDTGTVAAAAAGDTDAQWSGQLLTAAIAMHEYGHAIDFAARGVTLPAGTTLDDIYEAEPTAGQSHASHGAGWLRAYCHLLYRSMATPAHRDFYTRFAAADVESHGLGEIDDFFATLDDEAGAVGTDTPLVEIVSTPAPTAFVDLFNTRDAARSAGR